MHLNLLLIFWLLFELIVFFRLGLEGAGQPLTWCIVKISVITSTIIELSTDRVYINASNIDNLIEQIKALSIDTSITTEK